MSFDVHLEVKLLVELLRPWLPAEHMPQYERDLLALTERVRADEIERMRPQVQRTQMRLSEKIRRLQKLLTDGSELWSDTRWSHDALQTWRECVQKEIGSLADLEALAAKMKRRQTESEVVMRNWDYVSPEAAKDELVELERRHEEAMRAAVVEEREACARIAGTRQEGDRFHSSGQALRSQIAGEIRARGQA